MQKTIFYWALVSSGNSGKEPREFKDQPKRAVYRSKETCLFTTQPGRFDRSSISSKTRSRSSEIQAGFDSVFKSIVSPTQDLKDPANRLLTDSIVPRILSHLVRKSE